MYPIAKCDKVRKSILSSFFSYKKKKEGIYCLLLSGKAFHFPDASPLGNLIALLLKLLEMIALSYILCSWSSCHHYPCISITTYIYPFPWERTNRMMLTLLKFHIRLNFYVSSLRSSNIEAWKSLRTLHLHKTPPWM